MTFTAADLTQLATRFGDGGPRADRDSGELSALVRRLVAASGGDPSSCEVSGDAVDPWIRVTGAHRLPRQGWKVHLSCQSFDIERLLEVVIPLLTARRASWKCVTSTVVLESLNQGEGGISQIGKGVTVYPVDDADAVSLAVELDAATRTFTGPRVPSDRPLRIGSTVSYRFGAFGSADADADGVIVDLLEGPDGQRDPDRRGSTYHQPSWVSDPFIAAGASEAGSVERRVVGDVLLGPMLHRSPRGAVHLGTRMTDGSTVVVKRADVGAVAGAGQIDALVYLHNEAQALRHLDGVAGVPAFIDRIDMPEAQYLVMSPATGPTVSAWIADRAAKATSPPTTDALRIGSDVGRIVQELHDHGVVHRDLKPGNVAVDRAEGAAFLMDFDFAAVSGERLLPCIGTRGYASPQQVAGDDPLPSDDVFGFGSLLGVLVSGADAAAASDPFRPFARPLTSLVPGVPVELEALVASCHDLDPAARPSSVGEVVQRIARLPLATNPALGDPVAGQCALPDAEGMAALVSDLVDDLAVRVGSLVPSTSHTESIDVTLYSGAAGVALALAELSALGFGDVSVSRDLMTAAVDTHLRQGQRDGLFHGDAGVAIAAARCAAIAGDVALGQRGAELLDRLLDRRVEGIELTAGAAGQMLAHLMAADLVGDNRHVDAARREAERVIEESVVFGDRRWWAESDDPPMLGYAHGVAGIAHALAEAGMRLDETDLLVAAAQAGRFLVDQAVELDDDPLERVGFPERVGGVHLASLWCHGTTGITRALMGVGDDAATRAMAWRGAVSAVRGPLGTLGPTQCHGIAGTLELALDAAVAFCDDRFVAEAASLARILEGFCIPSKFGRSCPGDRPGETDPSFMTGQAGVAWALARLATGCGPLVRTGPVRFDGRAGAG